jgi:hypothetical protein
MPAKKQKIDVRVPDGNVAQKHAAPVVKQKYFSFLILFVMPNIMNATAVAAMLMPKFAASLNTEKYRMRVPPLIICVL